MLDGAPGGRWRRSAVAVVAAAAATTSPAGVERGGGGGFSGPGRSGGGGAPAAALRRGFADDLDDDVPFWSTRAARVVGLRKRMSDAPPDPEWRRCCSLPAAAAPPAETATVARPRSAAAAAEVEPAVVAGTTDLREQARSPAGLYRRAIHHLRLPAPRWRTGQVSGAMRHLWSETRPAGVLDWTRGAGHGTSGLQPRIVDADQMLSRRRTPSALMVV